MSSAWTTSRVLLAAAVLRIVFLLYGLYQDTHSPLKYTDIDYYVFTDAARFVARGRSPYDRDTYRYTPLLAWLLLPTTRTSAPGGPTIWFSFGKVVFAVADLIAGWLLILIFCSPAPPRGTLASSNKRPDSPSVHQNLSHASSLKYASIWLLNPMVATISARGSAEGLLGALVLATLWALLRRRIVLAGLLLGLAVHFKIYPIIYTPTFLLYLQSTVPAPSWRSDPLGSARAWLNRERVALSLAALASFAACNAVAYAAYGTDFLHHAYWYHLTRSDHRHNFSPYSTLLYASSAASATAGATPPSFLSRLPTLAFVPQLLLSAVILPWALMPSLSRHGAACLDASLPSAMLAQTLTFVALNKVCTAQYFLWYLCLLPLHLAARSAPVRQAKGRPVWMVRDVALMAAWVGTQAVWLAEAYRLEFEGKSTFVPGLWMASLAFYLVNMGLLGVVIEDVGALR